MIAIVDYGMGNVTSVSNAFKHLGIGTILTNNISELEKSRAIVLPGVGAFGNAVEELNRLGLLDYLKERQQREDIFTLGICLGLQLFYCSSEEGPGFEGLCFFPRRAYRFPGGVKVPQIGWNRVCFAVEDPLFEGVPDGSHFYFAHSYYIPKNAENCALAWGRYGVEFTAAVKKGGMYGVQFHPEKSGLLGLRILHNFGRMVEECS